MCGILGLVHDKNFNSNLKLDYIEHRGPDSSGIFSDSHVFFGHTRLAIQDLTDNGRQPMFSKDGKFVIIFNGEIYNHFEIRKKYLSHINFISQSDTETLLYGYIELGADILNLLNGIFAFSIYDIEKKDLFIARDHFGVKPLYLCKDNKFLAFSSELKALLNLNFNKELNLTAFANYLLYLWSPGKTTPFKFIEKLLPGHFLHFKIDDFKNAEQVKYYKTKINGNYSNRTEKELIDELDFKLRNAVKRQMLSDVPVGFFLSGGLDSSLIVAIAKDIYPDKELNCFTIDVSKDLNKTEIFENDLYYAQEVSIFLDVKLNIVPAEIDIIQDFDKMIWHLDEPQADPAPLNVLNIAKMAKSMGIKVLIGGTGGDDLFSGYRRHQAIKILEFFSLFPSTFRTLIKNIFSNLFNYNTFFRRFNKLIINFDKSLLDQLISLFQWLQYDKVKKLFSNNSLKTLHNYNPYDFFKFLLLDIPGEKNSLNRMLYWELNSFLVDHNLNYTDKMSMSVGVETRVPFLDIDLVEFSQTLPPILKLKGKETKYILKKVAEKYLPKHIIYRSKTGFGAPVRKWVTNDLDHIINHKLSSVNIKKRGIFNSDEIRKLINENKEGKIDASYTIWALLSIESWLEQFLDKDNINNAK